jgi:hypothetical protein
MSKNLPVGQGCQGVCYKLSLIEPAWHMAAEVLCHERFLVTTQRAANYKKSPRERTAWIGTFTGIFDKPVDRVVCRSAQAVDLSNQWGT